MEGIASFFRTLFNLSKVAFKSIVWIATISFYGTTLAPTLAFRSRIFMTAVLLAGGLWWITEDLDL